MCVLVGIPTVLIDTQTRIILLGRNNTRTATVGAIGMAVMEISLRAGKAALLTWEIRHRKASLKQKHAAGVQQQEALEGHPTGKRVVPRAPSTLHSSLSSRVNNFEVWRHQAQTFHKAKLNADMYAEYISIGCSASVLFFYGNHPHYWLLRQSGNSEINAGSWRMSQLGMLFMQIGVEVVVDYASIILEVMMGVKF
ncbi:hypothetical protein PHYPSEUDO_002510 [Phytophthora pseudosyringae]|uniref:Uncharacterized protein n=1 Tax=Phytophthora pseudosyringae TaxID=221518 RepID=A0A8T1VSV6_9STRA|nr:hypothetical protein PHYPSEUDO_002510 [Phytophthora pseudosyringae]